MSHTQQIRDLGLKVTGPRLKILNLFETYPERHLSAEDVYRITVEENMGIGVATVYRVLSQFEEAGILKSHHFESGKAFYELEQGDHHDHIVCVECGKITEFFDARIEEMQKSIARQNGYDMIDHALYMYGICGDCQKKRATEKS